VAACIRAERQIAELDQSDDPTWVKCARARTIITPLIDEAGAAVRHAVNWMAEGDPTPARPRRRRRWWIRGRS
jgi:hypothetical protein